mgnify:CR=1 FL=1
MATDNPATLPTLAPPPGISWALWNATKDLHERRQAARLSSASPSPSPDLTLLTLPTAAAVEPSAEPSPSPSPVVKTAIKPGHIAIFPEILTGILQAKEVAPGRVWLVARSLPGADSGRVLRADLVTAFPKLGARRLRQILQQWNGQYWFQYGPWLWLKGQARLGAAVNMHRARRDAVIVPVAKLTASVKSAKAIMWDAVLSGRTSPISRDALSKLGVKSVKVQRQLEKMQRVKASRQYAILGTDSDYDRARASENGEPVFTFRDHKGQMGDHTPGNVYLVRHLPNTYTGTLKTVSHGKKWFNRQLGKLHDKGPGANEQPKIERVFFADGKRAGRASDKQPMLDVYWPTKGKGKLKRALWECWQGRSLLEQAVILESRK